MILQGNSYRIPLADNSVHCVISSFPYWGLRDYGLPPTIWGGRVDCRHEWAMQRYNPNPHGDNGQDGSGLQGGKSTQAQTRMGEMESAFCVHCGAWRGCFGLEPSIALHVQNAVAVCREIKRVLRPDGIFWLNYGDSYATSRNGRSAADTKAAGNDDRTFRDKPFSITELPAKNLCGIPWRVALALQDDGWILRSDIIWSKKNPMPESVTDRPTKSHEYIFMLAKEPRYFYDQEAIKEESIDNESYTGIRSRNAGSMANYDPDNYKFSGSIDENGKLRHGQIYPKRNRRSVWELATESYSGAHYATFPTKLVEPMVLASTSARGCCPECGRQWVRVTKPTEEYAKHLGHDWADDEKDREEGRGHFIINGFESGQRRIKRNAPSLTASYQTTGWRPSCSCGCEPVPSIVLDPFCGSGTTGEVCRQLGRRFIGIDLSAEYLQKNALPRAERKTSQAAIEMLPLFSLKI